MKLNVLERVTLLGILPTEGSYITFKLLTNLKSELSFSEVELKEFDIKESDGRIFWTKSEDKEIEIGDKAKEIIKEALKKLDEAGKINEGNASLYERFMIE
jgi:hypothetical protein